MKYIDWYYERTHNKGTGKNTQDKKYSGYRYWKDLVTETQYYISDTNYNRIYKTGKEMLETYKRNNDLKAIEDIFTIQAEKQTWICFQICRMFQTRPKLQ